MKRGRSSPINEQDFINALATAKTLAEVVEAIPSLQEMEQKKAFSYVSIRASQLRKKGLLAQDVKFKRGRKKSSIV